MNYYHVYLSDYMAIVTKKFKSKSVAEALRFINGGVVLTEEEYIKLKPNEATLDSWLDKLNLSRGK